MTKPFLKRGWGRDHIVETINYENLPAERKQVKSRRLTKVDEFQLLVYGRIFLPALVLIADFLEDGQLDGFGLSQIVEVVN